MGDRKEAVKFYNQAVAALNDKQNPEHQKTSYQLFASACMTDPTWSEAFHQAGANSSDLGHIASAIALWQRALQGDAPDLLRAKTLANLGWRLHCVGQTQAGMDALNESIRLNPNEFVPWVSLSCAYQIVNDMPNRLRTAEMAYALAPTDPLVELNMAFANLDARRLATGFKHFECRYAYKLKSYLQFPYPKWEGQDGATIYLDADQGLGDTLSFARFIPAAAKKAKYIHCCIQPELSRLFHNAFVGIPNLNIVPKPAGFLPADYWSTFVSLPFALGLTDEQIRNTPGIVAPPTHIPVNWKLPDRKLHVGIAWAGSDLNDINRHRSIPVEQFYDLFRASGVQLYALQCDHKRQQLYDTGGSPLVVDLARFVSDVVDTIAIIRNLDLVITCESALGHIAAVADKECWVPYSRLGKDYRLGVTGDDCFWYPRHRTFNQGPDLQWQPVFSEMVEALKERTNESLQRNADRRVRAISA